MKNIWINLFIFAAKKIGYIKKEYTQEQIKLINRLKVQFKIYFEDWDYIHISKFEITDFDFKFKNNEVIWKIILNRPGILIGKEGRTIDDALHTHVYRTKDEHGWDDGQCPGEFDHHCEVTGSHAEPVSGGNHRGCVVDCRPCP